MQAAVTRARTASAGYTKNRAAPGTQIAAVAPSGRGKPGALQSCSAQPVPSGQAAPCPFGTSAGEARIGPLARADLTDAGRAEVGGPREGRKQRQDRSERERIGDAERDQPAAHQAIHGINVESELRRPPPRGRGADARSGRGGISPAELALAKHRSHHVGASHRLETSRAVLLPDQEHDALPIDHAAVNLGQRHGRIPGAIQRAAQTADLDDEILSALEGVDGSKAQIEAAAVELTHAAREGVEPRFQRPA